MLAVLNIFVFILPCDSGKKSSYPITVFLAFVVFLSIISAAFPENSKVVALFSVYLIIQTLQSTVITLIVLVLTRVASFDSRGIQVPRRLDCLLKIITFSCRFKNCHRKDKVTDIELGLNADTKNLTIEDIENIREKPRFPPRKSDEEETEANPPGFNTWKEVVNTLDVVIFVFFTFVLVISTVGFFTLSATTKN